MGRLTESEIEDAALGWLESLGYAIFYGPDIAASETAAERNNYSQVVLEYRLRQALARLNPYVPKEALEDAYRKLTRTDAPSLLERNRAVHRMLVDGVTVEYRRKDGSIAGAQARVIDFDRPDNNDWLAVNQFTVVEKGSHKGLPQHRRPDVVLFVNGMPLAVIELKNAADENATIWSAYQQLQTYQAQIPVLFATNAALVISDGVQARIGALGAGREWFKPWRTIANTRAVFGDYISVYDIQCAVIDGATVPIYYESRLAKLALKDSERPKIDPEFEEATEGEEVERKEKLKSRWAQLEAVVGSDNRIKLVARDLVEHFENRLATLEAQRRAGRSFAGLLEQAVRKYQNRAIETAQVIEELIQLAKDMRAANERGEALNLTEVSWPSTMRLKPMTARSKCLAMTRCEI